MASSSYYHTNNKELRIVLVGKTGNGKSASGNTILSRQCFESKFSAKSTTVDCFKERGLVFGQQVAVIDTPGLFDTRLSMDQTIKNICQCISYAAPGPHVFLVVIKLGRYTEEEQHTVKRIQEIFGPLADTYSMVLFTGGDQIEGTIEQFIAESQELRELVARYDNQYHVFNNKSVDPTQVCELLQKIKALVNRNGGSHYTNQMFQETESIIEEVKQRLLMENQVKIHQEQEAKAMGLWAEHEREKQRMILELQAERERVRREFEWQRMKETMEREMELTRLKYEREMKERLDDIKAKHEREARDKAEASNPVVKSEKFYPKIVRRVGRLLTGKW